MNLNKSINLPSEVILYEISYCRERQQVNSFCFKPECCLYCILLKANLLAGKTNAQRWCAALVSDGRHVLCEVLPADLMSELEQKDSIR